MRYLIILLFASFSSLAQPININPILSKAEQQYKNSGASAFMKSILVGSSYNNEAEVKQNIAALKHIESLLGRFHGLERIKDVTLNHHSGIVYFTLDYQTGAAFGHLIYYRTDSGKIVTSQMQFDMNAWKVLPLDVLAGE